MRALPHPRLRPRRGGKLFPGLLIPGSNVPSAVLASFRTRCRESPVTQEIFGLSLLLSVLCSLLLALF